MKDISRARLVEVLATGLPLKQCAERLGITFDDLRHQLARLGIHRSRKQHDVPIVVAKRL